MIPSPFQSAIYDFVEYDTKNCVIDAVAGSGKSTTIVNALKIIDKSKSILFLAFNKSIVEELKLKIGNISNVDVKTLHSLGSSAMYGSYKSKVVTDKYTQYVYNGIKNNTICPSVTISNEDIADYRSNINKLVDLGRATLCNSVSELDTLSMKYDINIIDNECNVAMDVINWGKKEVGQIDFTDMIYLPNVIKVKMPQYDMVFIDECQDLNASQRELFLKCVKPGGRFVAVGDPRQAIYGFAGADVQSFNKLKDIENTVSLPLSVCYRCGSDIISFAQSIVPHIESRENSHTGSVVRDSKLSHIKDGDMVLCRVTTPLISLCMKYISEGTKAHVKGKDIGVNLINMIKRTKKSNTTDILKSLDKESKKIIDNLIKRKGYSKDDAMATSIYKTHMDKVGAIEVLSEGIRTSLQLITRIEVIFKDNDKSGICLSTIHKSKGLESDNVYIICEDKMFLKRCMGVDWMAEQEHNLAYVAYTRARNVLGFISDFQV